ncbi:MAG: sugar transferase [Solirubrobacterales bacterium]|nr:sugar transferase [Solirubrobacterales bacterium]
MSETATVPPSGTLKDETELQERLDGGAAALANAGAPRLQRSERVLLHATEKVTPRRDSLRRRALAVADLTALALAEVVVRVFIAPDATLLEKWYLLAALPMWVVLNKLLGLYDRDASLIHKSTLDELPTIALSLSLGTALAFLFGPLLPGLELGREQCIVFLVAGIAFTPVLRWSGRSWVRQRVEPERCLLVGSGQAAEVVARKLFAHPEYGTKLVGYVDVPPDTSLAAAAGTVPHLGDDDAIEEVIRRFDVERVVVAFSSLSDDRLLDIIRVSKRLHVKVTIVPRLYEVIGGGVEIDQIEGLTLLGLRGLVRTNSTLMLKRAIDITGAGLGLLLLTPLLAVVALAVKLTSSGPVLFAHERVGRGSRPFTMHKFRTMVDGAEALKPGLAHLNEMGDGPMFKISDDPRVTPLGRLLRRTSLDELPQLWNVLRGEMSLVGPRPLVLSESDHVLGWHRARLDLTPGLTGPWQVMGRNAIPFEEMVKLDYLYVADWSLWNDVKLLLRTLPVLVWRTGS